MKLPCNGLNTWIDLELLFGEKGACGVDYKIKIIGRKGFLCN